MREAWIIRGRLRRRWRDSSSNDVRGGVEQQRFNA